MKTFLRFIPAALAVLLAGCGEKSPSGYQGYIEGEYVYVAAPLSGMLTNLAVARGDSVKSGQALFELEGQLEAAAFMVAEKNLAQARASLDLMEATYQRRKELHETPSGVVSAEELDRARADRDAAASQTASLQAALDKAQWAVDQKRQSAPADATVHDTLYRQGEYVMAGNPVVSLLPPANLKVRFFVPQDQLPHIKTGEAVSVKPDGAAHPLTATVNYISTQAEYTPPVIFSRETRANLVFMIEAKFAPADAAELRPGQPVDVELK